MDGFDRRVVEVGQWMAGERFAGLRRLYSPRDVAEQQGTIPNDYVVARMAAESFHHRLRELFALRRHMTTFGPYSPGQAVAMKRMGIEGIYLGGWATSAKGSVSEDPGPDLASYPLSQVPDEAAGLVRALLTADRNQQYARARMTDKEREDTPEVDFRPFIVADADTGHGGDAHVRNLIRRFVEVGVPGYHIEDQKPGAKKCGHQAGKVLVTSDEQIKRLNAARFQLDVMRVPGLIVARTDAEAATLLDGRHDERDQPFILGTTNTGLPSYKAAFAALLMKLSELHVEDVYGHLLFGLSSMQYESACQWLEGSLLMPRIAEAAAMIHADPSARERLLEALDATLTEAWYDAAAPKTYVQAVADEIAARKKTGQQVDVTLEAWTDCTRRVSFFDAQAMAHSLGVDINWDCERCKTPDGYYLVEGGLDFAIAKSLAAAPFADLIWMETKVADLDEARMFSAAIHAVYPDKMLAYNLSPSFNWDTTGMTDDEMKNFPDELGKLGFVFNFITYGGHQIDGLAAEEFSTALRKDGMLALARLQRKLRLLDSPYRTPQTLVGGPRLDEALMASSGRTAATKAMSKGSTQFQHLVQTEVPTTLLANWLEVWRRHHSDLEPLFVSLRPHTAGTDVLALRVNNVKGLGLASLIFVVVEDRHHRPILTIRDQHAALARYDSCLTLMQLFLIHRFGAHAVHLLAPTASDHAQMAAMAQLGILNPVHAEVDRIIVADVGGGLPQLLRSSPQELVTLVLDGVPQPSS